MRRTNQPIHPSWSRRARVAGTGVRGTHDRVRIELGPASQTAPQVMLSPQPVVAPEILQVDGITANQVQARAIYANRIDADRVRGNIYQTADVQNLWAGRPCRGR